MSEEMTKSPGPDRNESKGQGPGERLCQCDRRMMSSMPYTAEPEGPPHKGTLGGHAYMEDGA